MIRASLFHRIGGIAALIALIAAPQQASAQEAITVTDPYVEFGIVPAAVMTLPLGRLETIRESVPCSRTLQAMANVNPACALRGGYVIDGDLLSPGFRLRGFHLTIGYDDLSSRFESSGESYEAYDAVNGAYGTVETKHSVEFDLEYLRAAADVDMAVGGNLIVRGGANFSAPLAGSSRQSERIITPENATFLDRTQEQTIAEGTGELSDLISRLGIHAGLVYRLPLGRKLFFEPNIGVDFGLTGIQSNWSPLLVRGGISIGYSFISDPIVVLPPSLDTLVVVEVEEEEPRTPRPPFTAELNIDVAAEKLPVEFRRQIVARYVPVLPTIFFAPNASTIPERYIRRAPAGSAPRGGEAESFDESLVPANAEQAHYHTLDIFGKRLKEDGRAKVTVTGTTSRDEENRSDLARARAQAIADYWATTWGIDRNRIAVRSRIDPALPSNADYPEGREENRRVELDFSDDDIYRPIQLRAVEPMTEPREIPFRVSASSPFHIERWRMEITVGNGSPEMIEGPGIPSGLVEWKLAALDRERVLMTGAVNYVLTVYDGEGRSMSTLPKGLPIRLDTTITVSTSADRPVNTAEFLLVTFDFDRADLTRRGRQELETILARIGPASEVSIVGYTDPVGEVERNRSLALARAQKVAAAMPKDAKVEVRGAAPDEAPYSSGSPEGRFLSRTVRVVIRNPR